MDLESAIEPQEWTLLFPPVARMRRAPIDKSWQDHLHLGR
jgi:hypothetical protein